MTTLYGAWQGSGGQARIYCSYTVSYSADNTQAIYAISFGVEFGGSVSDSSNSWAVSGDCGSASGSNVSYSVGSSGGTKLFRTGETAQKYGNATVSASISGVEGVGGGTISATFTLSSGPLAPYFTDPTYSATGITATSASFSGWGATGNNSGLNNIQVQYNTVQSATGASVYTKGVYGTPTITGLTQNTQYYARIRFSNSGYGYGAWGYWATFKTLSSVPSVPSTAWYIGDISATSCIIGGTSCDNNGSPLVEWHAQYAEYGSDINLGAMAISTDPNIAPPLSYLTPMTRYNVRIRGRNGNGDGAWSDVKDFTTLPGVLVNVDGVWKDASPYINVGGVWKPAICHVNVDGIWKS